MDRVVHWAWTLVFAATFSASADVWYVSQDNTSGTEDGTSWATAFTTIQAAIDAAKLAPPAEIWVAEGVYDELRGDPTGAVVMAENVDLYGGFAGEETQRSQRDWVGHETVIDGSVARGGAPADHVVIGERNSRLDGFSIICATADTAENGRGMYNNEAIYPDPIGMGVVVANCKFEGLSGQFGGAIYNQGVAITIHNCRFENNYALLGGAAIYNLHTVAFVSDCRFTDNASTGDGGAMRNYLASVLVERCRFADNDGAQGGGIYNETYSSGDFTNCIFVNNHAGTEGEIGGAICNNYYSDNVEIVNCTFFGNEATDGAAVGSINGGGSTLRNCIAWGNAGTNQIAGALLAMEYCDIEDWTPSGTNIQADPLFYDASIGDVRLRTGSPCLDAGTSTGAPIVDIEGRTRPLGGSTDIGAYEMPVVLHVKRADPPPPVSDGLTWASAFTELAHAVSATSPIDGGHIWVAEGVYDEDRYGTGGQLILYEGTELYGGFAGTETALTERDWATNVTVIEGGTANGGVPTPHVLVMASHCVVDGFTVRGGYAIPPYALGGAVTITGDPVTIANCVFTDNAADAGGGALDLNRGSPRIANCSFSENHSANGGAVLVWGPCSPVFDSCRFADNQAIETPSVVPSGFGGAVDVWAPSVPSFSRCVFERNFATFNGGAVQLRENAEAEFTNCVSFNNIADTGIGGAIHVAAGASLSVLQSTLARDWALMGPELGVESSTLVTVANSILWTDLANAIYAPGSPLPIVYYSDVKGWPAGGGTINADPLFFDLAGGNFMLRSSSPCLDSAGLLDLADVDVRDVPRPQGAWHDMGAYEMRQYTLLVASMGNGQTTPPVGSHACTEQDTIVLTAIPDEGSYFHHWEGDVSGADAETQLTMDADKSVAAVFRPCRIVVMWPNGGETLTAGKRYRVRWQTEGTTGAAVRIELLRRGRPYKLLKSETPNDGVQRCRIPADAKPGSKYQLRVTSTTNAAYTDASDAKFSIEAHAAADSQ